MSVEENKATLRKYYDEIFNKGDLSHWSEMVDDTYVMKVVGGQELKGLDGAKQTQAQRAFSPDMTVSIDEMVAEGDIVFIRGEFTGTNTGEYQGMGPTGKKFVRAFAASYKFKDGKIVGGWALHDLLGFYQQLGMSPPGG